MVWVKIDDSFADHPKLVKLSDKAFRTHLRALCLCARQLTDGLVLTAWKGQLGLTPKLVAELRDALLWDDAAGGFQIHDYLKYNPSRESVLGKREGRSEAGKAGARGRWRDGKTDGKSHPDRIPDRIANVHAPVPVPVPPASQSSAGAEPPPADVGFRDRMGIMIVAQDRIPRDATLYSEAEQIATDYSYEQIQNAINETRRSKDERGPMKPYPSNWRKFLIPDPKPKVASQEGPIMLSQLMSEARARAASE